METITEIPNWPECRARVTVGYPAPLDASTMQPLGSGNTAEEGWKNCKSQRTRILDCVF